MALRVFEIYGMKYFFLAQFLHHLWNKSNLPLDTHHLIECVIRPLKWN